MSSALSELPIPAPAAPPAALNSIPLVPDSAPFTPAQRAWLNGFFAGLLGIEKIAGQNGSNGAASAPAEVEEDFPWHDPSMALEDRLKLAEGKPLDRQLMASMAQLDCGACGYLCKTYAEAIATGAEKSLTKCVPGGGQTARKLKELLKNATLPVSASPAQPKVEIKEQAAGHSVHTARFMHAKPLNAEGSSKDTRWVAIDLSGSGLTYQTGDSLGVHVENDPELVRDLVAAFGAKGSEEVKVGEEKLLLNEALWKKCDIVQASPDLVELLAASAKDPAETATLKALVDGAMPPGFDKDPQIIDLLTHFPSARPSIEAFVTALSPLRPRLYSISSSPKAHPAQVHLTIAAVRYEMAGRKRKGVASTFFADRIESGAELKVFVHNSPHFRLPKDPQTPVIMVGPGTGIAPFRAFLQEREATGAKGKNWLFFGDQHEATDYLFRDEMNGWHDTGFLSRLDLAFSRDQQEKIYVQTRMKEKGLVLWEWLNKSGAYFYVCGDAKKMARDVDQALQHIAMKHGGLSEADAKAYVAKMVKDGRYCKDVY